MTKWEVKKDDTLQVDANSEEENEGVSTVRTRYTHDLFSDA